VKVGSSVALATAGGAIAFGSASASLGPTAFAVSGGLNLIGNAIDIGTSISKIINTEAGSEDKEIEETKKLLKGQFADAISNICRIVGPIILLCLGTNPIGLAILGGIVLIGILAYMYANWDAIKAMLKGMEWYHYLFYAAAFAGVIAVSLFGGVIPAAQYWLIPLLMALPSVVTALSKKKADDPVPLAVDRRREAFMEEEKKEPKKQSDKTTVSSVIGSAMNTFLLAT
jgi:hypothetical protein